MGRAKPAEAGNCYSVRYDIPKHCHNACLMVAVLFNKVTLKFFTQSDVKGMLDFFFSVGFIFVLPAVLENTKACFHSKISCNALLCKVPFLIWLT